MVSPKMRITPLLKLFLLLDLVALLYALTPKYSNDSDRLALLEFKSRLDENSLLVLSSWNDSLVMCKWVGVKCNIKHQRVTSLNLEHQKLAGVISPAVGNLSFLRSLRLGDNSFRTYIPHEIGKLSRLQNLNLSFNALEGSIPVSLANCSNLRELDLSYNHLEQIIPSELGFMSNLVYLNLANNTLTGKFPASFGNLTSLRRLYIAYNSLDGEIPDPVAYMESLSVFQIAANSFSGVFPPSLYNLSSLTFLSLAANSFYGTLRPSFGDVFPNLRGLFVGGNNFSGRIPLSLSNISTLKTLEMSINKLTGSIPVDFGNLQNLQMLDISNNLLGNQSINDIDFLGALTNCSKLQVLDVGYNRLGGALTNSIANLSTELTLLYLGGNFITGSIPFEIGNLASLTGLGLERNLLTGEIPESVGKLLNMRALYLHSNQLTGWIPSSIGNITHLLSLYLLFNTLEGTIPPTLGNCSDLLILDLSLNKLHGTLPKQVIGMASLLNLDVSSNSLTGQLPQEVGNLKGLFRLDISDNKLTGELPATLGKCLAMQMLFMQINLFKGSLPDFSGMKGIEFLDVSQNNLSGHIPKYMADFRLIQNLNLSFNEFEDQVPTQGIFRNASIVAVYGNSKLCGGIQELHLQPCPPVQNMKKPRKHLALFKLVTSIVIVVLFMLILVFVSRHCLRNRRIKNPTSDPLVEPFHQKISYKELLDATEGFSSNNLIGSGHFGSVYKAVLPPKNNTLAIKVLKLQQHGASKSFVAECEALKNVRHRNLVKIVTACSGTDFQGNEFKALVYELMPNGSLDNWLHPEEAAIRSLKFLERLNIAIDVAAALVYLHNSCGNTIVHCDLKPSNVLLDNDLIAHVSDFGLARLLSIPGQESFTDQLSSIGIKGTLGYAAPEYGYGGQPSTTGDVYSYGILLLEMFTGKRPTDELFINDLNLHSFVKSALPARVLEIADQSLFEDRKLAEGLTMIFDIGVQCSETCARDRMEIVSVLKVLISIREIILD